MPAIIDEETHRLAQAQLERNAKLSFRNNKKHSYLLRCLLSCERCGLAMYGVTYKATERQPERRYYQCGGKDPVLSAREHKCLQRPAKAEEPETAVWNHVKELMNDPERLLAQFESFARSAPEGEEKEHTEQKKFEAHVKRLSREESRLVDAYQAEVIDLEELKERREKIEERRRALAEQHEQRARLRERMARAREVLEDLNAFCERISSRLKEATFEEKQAILQLLIERIIVGEDALEIRYVIPLDGPPRSPSGPAAPSEPGLRSDGVGPATLPRGPGQDRLDGALQTPVGVARYQPHLAEPPGDQRTQEGAPEGAVLAGTHVQPQNLPLPAPCLHPDGDHHRHGNHSPVLAGLHVGGIDPDVGVGTFERPVAKALDLLVQLLAEPADIRLL